MRALQLIERTLTRVFGRRGLLLILCLGGGGTLSWWLGQDINWDLKNYHLYNPYALLQGRLTTDLVPASLQSFSNPLADIPYYLLAAKLLLRLPRVLAFLQGFYFGALVYFVFRLNRHAFAQRAELPATTATIASLIGVSAAGVVSEIGTTFNDIQGALFILWGVYLLMPNEQADTVNVRRAIWAGVTFGVAVAVKLTGVFYVVAAIFAIFISYPVKAAMRLALLTCISTGACALLLCGPWSLWLYYQTGSPVFPFFNEYFRSDWYPPMAFWQGFPPPPSFLATLFYPFAWAKANHHVISEVEFRDARFAAAWTAGVFVLTTALVAFGTGRMGFPRFVFPRLVNRPTLFLLAFAIGAYVVWITQMKALRYGIVPEVLTGAVIILGIEAVAGLFIASRFHAIAAIALSAGMGLALQAATIYPTWGRVRYEQRTFTVGAPPLPASSLVVLVGVPLSFVVPFLRPQDFTAVGISHHTAEARGYRLFDETKKRIAGHTGSAFVLIDDNSQGLRGLASELGVTWEDEPCSRVGTNVYAAFRLCPMRRR